MEKEITGKIKLPPVSQVGMVVKDIDKVMQFYSDTFGIGPWVVKEGEYRELKEYTDLTTHELQTPLAVI